MPIMKTSDFDYYLPEELIAQTPIYPRDTSRLLVYDRNSDTVSHEQFFNLKNHLKKGDLLVINNTKVLPARLMGKRVKDGVVLDADIEVLLLKRKSINVWECLTKPARKLMPGTKVVFSNELSCTVLRCLDEGIREVEFSFDGVFEDVISRVGTMPLPPYITEKLSDQARYQTVYGKVDGSSAAPTAGLHFTPELLQELKDLGVEICEVLLHVGLGTFKPVKADDVLDHKMHSEYYEVSKEVADKINTAKAEDRRVIAVGTTSIRVLESATSDGKIVATSGNTSIFIYPGYEFKTVDGLITNFHLPKSTLIMLVSAFMGKDKTLELYNLAVKEKYRFFSFGDAMLIL